MFAKTIFVVCYLFSLHHQAPQPPQRRLPEAEIPARGLRTLPDWARSSWFMRRQIEKPWVLAGANIIDVNTGAVRKNVNITIAADLIRSIDSNPPPAGTETVDAKGKFIIPGLFDLHAHVTPASRRFPGVPGPEATLAALLDAGVTTIRILPLVTESAAPWSARINNGELTGPTMVAASAIFEKEPQRTSRGFGDPKTARAWVRKEALLGSRWIKVYNSMDEASLKTIVETARAYGMRVCGHADDVPPGRASEIGMASIEHITGIPLSCLKDGAGIPKTNDLVARTAARWNAVDPEQARRLMATFKANGTAWVPTLVVTENIALAGSHDGVATEDASAVVGLRAAIERAARLAVHLHRAGGLVGLGTDFPIDGVRPGESVHREMQLLVEHGKATPLEALQIATIASARILGFEALLGTVEPNKLAHLVVLEKNPLDDIANTRSIAMVVHDGRLHNPL